MQNVVVGLLVFVLALASDYLSTSYTRAVHAFECAKTVDDRSAARERAADASVLIWLVGVVGLYGILQYGLWVLAPEGLGLYFGTKLALR